MSDFYTEQLVKRQATSSSMMAKAGLIALTVVSALGTLFIPIMFVLLVVAVVLDFFMFPRLNVEYEYLYVNGDLDIDVIMNKQKRKKKFEMNISSLEMMAPQGAPEVKNMQTVKTMDFSSGVPENKKYEMVVMDNNQKVRVIFEPNQTILDGMRLMAPRKVIL